MNVAEKICTRCIYDSNTPEIFFDEHGVCRFCHLIEELRQKYRTGMPEGNLQLSTIVASIKESGRGKKYDCVVGVSGGTDSSFLIHWAVEQGLRPLAVHYDNTWNSAVASQNIAKVLSKLNVPLETYVCESREIDDIFRSFFLAGVTELDASTDLALAEVLYRSACRHRVKYVLEGHSFMTEGITPLSKNYFDGRYIKSIHKRFGSTKQKTYPLMTLSRFLRWTLWHRIRKIRPFWYLDYDKSSAAKLLEETYGWQDYHGHHLENRMTAFVHSVYYPQKVKLDYRNNSLAASVRSGHLDRTDAIRIYYQTDPYIESGLIELVKKRLNLTPSEYQRGMSTPPVPWSDFPNYKRIFERLRFLFRYLVKLQLVPESFFLKYCFPIETTKP